MKVVYLKIIDPIGWHKSDMRFYEDDLEYAVLSTLRFAGILIREDDEKIVVGEVTLAEDNPKLDEFEVNYPYYRHVSIIAKVNVLDRIDFEVPDTKK